MTDRERAFLARVAALAAEGEVLLPPGSQLLRIAGEMAAGVRMFSQHGGGLDVPAVASRRRLPVSDTERGILGDFAAVIARALIILPTGDVRDMAEDWDAELPVLIRLAAETAGTGAPQKRRRLELVSQPD